MAADLHSLVAGVLQPMTHAELNEAPQRIAGLVVPNGEGLSKRQRVELALENLTQEDLARLALKFAAHRGDIALDEAGRKVLEASDPPLSHITRRDVARVFGDDLAGERNTVEMVERLFVLSTPLEGTFGSGGRSLRDQIGQHMDRNPGDWSVEYLFGEIGAFDCSRARFAALLEDTVHPLARSGEEQLQTVAALNLVLARDGFELAQESELSGHPIFAFRSLLRGVSGRPKNLIFASRGPKPEIGFADAINNDIVILSGEESCLVYDRPINSNGILWSELVAWWSGVTPGANAANLGARLQESLASDAERKLFATYFKAYRSVLGEALPALLPQVYLHYDPAVVKTLRRRLPLPRQRMDFLLLLPGRQRIVLEVDGQHHFSENDHPSLKVYSDMVSADRELRLAGYEVYRFGANELVGDGAESRIADFFKKLFRLHRVGR
jgi:very-short-patch-repair endonuclease